jgi:molecular chaperone GrpE
MTGEELNAVQPGAEANMTEEEVAATPADDSVVYEAEVVDGLELLEEKLAQAEASLADAEKLAAEYKDGWQRAQAAFANFRKRTESEQAQAQSTANARLLARIVPVMDDFKRAFETVPEAYRDDPWLEGVRLVQRKLKSVLEAENVKPIEMKSGDLFDPAFHQAVLYQEVEGFDEGEIVTEIETGYLLSDRVLRPSLVVVAKGRPSEPISGDAEPETNKEADGDTDGTGE